jgi:diaminopimelate epimerase
MIEAEACGNTFLIYEMSLKETLDELQPLIIKRLISDRRDSGLLLKRISDDTWKMVVLEKDGSISSFCGNGSRAVACYLWETHGLLRSQLMNEQGETCQLEWIAANLCGVVSIQNVYVKNDIYYVLGEPHIIYQAPLEQIESLALGHKNVNISCIVHLESNRWKIATQERGVNAVTQSCGSGCVAAMHSLYLSGFVKKEAAFVCYGGENIVRLQQDGSYLLIGPASCEQAVRR